MTPAGHILLALFTYLIFLFINREIKYRVHRRFVKRSIKIFFESDVAKLYWCKATYKENVIIEDIACSKEEADKILDAEINLFIQQKSSVVHFVNEVQIFFKPKKQIKI